MLIISHPVFNTRHLNPHYRIDSDVPSIILSIDNPKTFCCALILLIVCFVQVLL